ncbi:MAG: hypothetical protein P8M50_05510 [Paracoccaceae bacterium]|nr:hypothetical protein [Paracoccaceae bacterium]
MKKFMGNANVLLRSNLFEDLISFILMVGIIVCLFGFPSVI